jgi:hypothetical protein
MATYTIKKNELTFYVDYFIHNKKCFLIQETKDDRVITDFICQTNKIICDDLVETTTEILITI